MLYRFIVVFEIIIRKTQQQMALVRLSAVVKRLAHNGNHFREIFSLHIDIASQIETCFIYKVFVVQRFREINRFVVINLGFFKVLQRGFSAASVSHSFHQRMLVVKITEKGRGFQMQIQGFFKQTLKPVNLAKSVFGFGFQRIDIIILTITKVECHQSVAKIFCCVFVLFRLAQLHTFII